MSSSLFLAQLSFQPSPPTLWNLKRHVTDGRVQKRPAGMGFAPVLQPSPSLGVKLIWWKVKSRFWVTSKFALLPHISQMEDFLHTVIMFTNQSTIWNINQVPWGGGGMGVQMHVSRKFFLYVAGISPPGEAANCRNVYLKHAETYSNEQTIFEKLSDLWRWIMLYTCKFSKEMYHLN